MCFFSRPSCMLLILILQLKGKVLKSGYIFQSSLLLPQWRQKVHTHTEIYGDVNRPDPQHLTKQQQKQKRLYIVEECCQHKLQWAFVNSCRSKWYHMYWSSTALREKDRDQGLDTWTLSRCRRYPRCREFHSPVWY